MKKNARFYFLLFVLTISGLTIKAQFWNWEDPVALTDSTADNCNPYLNITYFNSEEHLFMFWEVSSDSASTAIYFKDLLGSDDPVSLLEGDNIHYTNPTVMDVPNGDTIFYLFYETDELGKKDIHYLKFSEDGLFHGPNAFATSEFDDMQLCPGHESYWDGEYINQWVAWVQNGNIMARALDCYSGQCYFMEPHVIDSNNCSEPQVEGYSSSGTIYWLKAGDSISDIRISQWQQGGFWAPPEVFYDSGDCKNLYRDKVFGYLLCWSTRFDSVWKPVVYYWDDISIIEDYDQDHPVDPAVYEVMIPVRSQMVDYEPIMYLAFPYPDNGYDEIFINDDFFYYSGFNNLSNSQSDNRNPQFFWGESYNPYCEWIYLVWESFRNGHWTLYSSRTLQCIGGVDEGIQGQGNVTIYPNPCTEAAHISFLVSEPSETNIRIFNSQGLLVKNFTHTAHTAGPQSLEWNLRSDDGYRVKAGLYFVVVGGGAGRIVVL